MPSIVAHNHVAQSVNYAPHPDVLLGSVLPDFAGMYRDYHGKNVQIRGLSRNLDRGINLHLRTDRLYDSQLEKPLITTELTSELESEGLKPRAARLGAHLLADIMLDGGLLGRLEARVDFQTLAEYVLEEETMLHTKKFPEKFKEMTQGYFERDIPWKYRDPHTLAKIAKRQLDFRAARSSGVSSMIELNQLPVVAEVIERNTDTVRLLGLAALDRTIETLSEQQPSQGWRRFFRTA